MSEPENSSSETASSFVSSLPELIELIGQHLSPSSLVSSVRVCRTWNKILTPMLWHTVDTHSRHWFNIIHQDASGKRPRDDIEGWVKSFFENHGRHIRHMKAGWMVVLEAASLSGSGCRNLTSLVIGDLYQRYYTPSTVLIASNDPQLPWVSGMGMQSRKENFWHRYVIERFWILVRQNPGLVRLAVPCFGTINDLSPEYTFESFSMLKHLKDLDLGWAWLDVGLLLGVVPQLEQLRAYTLLGFTPLQQDYSSLRRLHYRNRVEILVLLELLQRLPGLEELQIWQLYVRPLSSLTEVSTAVAAMTPFPQLKLLRVDIYESYGREDQLTALLVRLCPGLVGFWTQTVGGWSKQALWHHCYFLDSIGYCEEGVIDAWRGRRGEPGICLQLLFGSEE